MKNKEMNTIIIRTKQHLSYIAHEYMLYNQFLEILLNKDTGLRALVSISEIDKIIGDNELQIIIENETEITNKKNIQTRHSNINTDYCAIAFGDNIVTGCLISMEPEEDFLYLKQSKMSDFVLKIPRKIIKNITQLDGSVTEMNHFSK